MRWCSGGEKMRSTDNVATITAVFRVAANVEALSGAYG